MTRNYILLLFHSKIAQEVTIILYRFVFDTEIGNVIIKTSGIRKYSFVNTMNTHVVCTRNYFL